MTESARQMAAEFFAAMAARDLHRLQTLLASGFVMTVSGSHQFTRLEDFFAHSRSRQSAVRKHIEGFDVSVQGDAAAVYCYGTMSGRYVFGDVGRMTAGGHAFWREGQWHGPAGSETGYCLLIRVLGGPLSNQFSAEPAPFSCRLEYQPSLPPHLQAIARPVDEGASW